MTTLSPKAMRFVAIAMRYATELDRAIWQAATVDQDVSPELPLAAVRAALNALGIYGQRIAERLQDGALDEDETADLSNDFRLVCSLQKGLGSITLKQSVC